MYLLHHWYDACTKTIPHLPTSFVHVEIMHCGPCLLFSRNNSSTCNNFGSRRQLLLRKLLQKAWVEEIYKNSANAFCAKKFNSLSRTAGVIQPVRVKNKGVLLLLCPFALREASSEAGCRATWPAFPQMHWHKASAMINCSQVRLALRA